MCIKIPATPESVVACKYLEQIGIRTLSTCLFSVPQALAAHQAGCLYIAPYFNGMTLFNATLMECVLIVPFTRASMATVGT